MKPKTTAQQCPTCGAPRYGNAIKCLKCGDENAFALPALINCPACKRDVSSKAISCPHCGDPLREPEQTQTATGLLAAILIALLVGGILYAVITSLH